MKIATFLLLYALGIGAALGQPELLGDPTRPAGISAAGVAGTEGGDGGSESSEGGLRLQSVVSSGGSKPTAIISGQVLRLGDMLGNARLVRLSETEAVLSGPQGLQRLKLTPDVEKVPLSEPPMDSKKPSKKKKEMP